MKAERTVYASLGDGYNERNDCVVRAISVAACLDYTLVHETVKKHGRRDGKRTDWRTLINSIAELCPGVPCKSTVHQYGCYITLSAFVRLHPTGHYIVRKSGHVFALIDGVVHDWGYHPRYVVTEYWKLC